MIPKIIHYCWFGGNPKPELVLKCIESWKKYCPDYEIVEWNESNFDVNCIPYVRDAYAAKKWAFVSDYARLKVVFERGGVYLDTDVLLRSSLDDLLQYDCWLASDDVRYIATGLGFGAIQGNGIIKALMDAYEQYTYPNGTNVTRDTIILETVLPEWNKSERIIVVNDRVLIIGCCDYGRYATHIYAYSWADDEKQKKTMIPERPSSKWESRKTDLMWKFTQAIHNPEIVKYMDQRKGTRLEKLYTFLCYDLISFGVGHYLRRLIHKIKQRFL